MAVFKRGNTCWYHFWWDGVHIQRSTRQSNRRAATQMEAVHKAKLARGEFGIVERKAVPTLKEFGKRFMEAIEIRCAAKSRTIEFYRNNFRVLEQFEPFAKARMDAIDESLISRFIDWRSRQKGRSGDAHSRKIAPATVNRALATLRRALRLAEEWRIISRVPRIRLLPGERCREFVLSTAVETAYLAACTEPLNSFARVSLETALRGGELLGLECQDVHAEPTGDAKRGYLHVRKGKTKNAKRDVPLTEVAASLLRSLIGERTTGLVFTQKDGKAVSRFSLEHQHAKIRRSLGLPSDFVLHSFRHTMLTRLGEAGVDAFTIMRIAGHCSVTVSQRYMHPTPETMQRAVERLESLNNSRPKAVGQDRPEAQLERSSATVFATAESHTNEALQ